MLRLHLLCAGATWRQGSRASRTTRNRPATCCQAEVSARNQGFGASFIRFGVRRAVNPPYGGYTSVALAVFGSRMRINSLMKQTVGVGLLLLSGCEVARSARDDLARLTAPTPVASQVRKSTQPQTAVRMRNNQAGTSTPVEASAAASLPDRAVGAPDAPSAEPPPVVLTGYSETELRALLGAPTSEEEHPPGKQWRYRDGNCTLDIQLYPDVETKKFGTLAYKVKSDDNTDEGKRLCLAQLQSRVQARRKRRGRQANSPRLRRGR